MGSYKISKKKKWNQVCDKCNKIFKNNSASRINCFECARKKEGRIVRRRKRK